MAPYLLVPRLDEIANKTYLPKGTTSTLATTYLPISSRAWVSRSHVTRSGSPGSIFRWWYASFCAGRGALDLWLRRLLVIPLIRAWPKIQSCALWTLALAGHAAMPALDLRASPRRGRNRPTSTSQGEPAAEEGAAWTLVMLFLIFAGTKCANPLTALMKFTAVT